MRQLRQRRAARAYGLFLAVVGLGAAPPGSGSAAPVVKVGNDTPAIPSVMPAKVTPAPTALAPTASIPTTPVPIAPALAAPAPAPVPTAPVAAAPAYPMARVYLIDGVDPFRVAGLGQTAERIRASGFAETRYGRWYQTRSIESEIRPAHSQNPEVPVVVIGYSLGAYRARGVVNRLTRDGVPVAMLGYVGGDYLTDRASSRPAAVGRVVNVRGDGFLLTGRNLFFNGTDLTGADNLRASARHYTLPGREETVSALVRGIEAATVGSPAAVTVAASPVPLSAPVTMTVPAEPVASTTRPLFPRLASVADRFR